MRACMQARGVAEHGCKRKMRWSTERMPCRHMMPLNSYAYHSVGALNLHIIISCCTNAHAHVQRKRSGVRHHVLSKEATIFAQCMLAMIVVAWAATSLTAFNMQVLRERVRKRGRKRERERKRKSESERERQRKRERKRERERAGERKREGERVSERA